MKRQNGLMTLLFAGLALVATAACDNTADGVKRDSEIGAADAQRAGDRAADATADAARDAGAATAEAGRDVASATGAAATTALVKTALTADTTVDASHIDVDSNGDAKTVTLKGRVPTAAQKTAAERIARDKAEGYTVVNQLVVG